jgi:hypothetical protein
LSVVRPLRLLCLVLLATASPGQPAAAQALGVEPLGLTFSVGTLRFGEIQGQPIQAQRLGDAGDVAETLILRRELGAASGLHVGAGVVIPLGPVWRGRLGVGLGRASLRQGFHGPDAWTEEAAAVPVTGERDVAIATGEAALRFVVPSRHALRPYLEVGVSAERWSSDSPGEAFPGAERLAEGVSRVGAHAAVGAGYAITSRLKGVLQASIRTVRTPLDPIADGVEIGRGSDMVLTALAPSSGPFADHSVASLRMLRLELGLSYSFGEARVAPRDQSGSDESSSVPGL